MDRGVQPRPLGMVRGRHVHVANHDAPPVRLWSDSRDEDESTKKVPDYLLAFALSCEDDLAVDTQPMVAPPVHPFSGIVPAGEQDDEAAASGPREVIPPPPRRPEPRTLAFAETLDAFAFTDVPFLAPAENDESGAAPTRLARRLRSQRFRANLTQSIAAALIALAALLVLFALGTKPRVIMAPAARTVITARARADRTDVSGSARAVAAPRITVAPPARPALAPPPPPAPPLPAPPPPVPLLRLSLTARLTL